MFEYHGWINLMVSSLDEAGYEISDEACKAREAEAWREAEAALEEARNGVDTYEMRACNWDKFLFVHGCRNHRYPRVIEMFRRIAERLPDSYGLLYVRDEEDMEYGNAFRVWRIARGVFSEEVDTLLSPCVPVIERPPAPDWLERPVP